MNLWIASMECAGIAEAGGVKNVTLSLCKEFSQLGHQVTLFIPEYKCTDFTKIVDFQLIYKNKTVEICGKKEKISYSKGSYCEGKFSVIFIQHPSFSEKEAVYTYTSHENLLNSEHKKGQGHSDTLFLNSLFSKAVCNFGKFLEKNEIPDIIHCQDASTALIPSFASQIKELKHTKTVVTIHNAGPAYHHNFKDLKEAEYFTGLKSDFLCGSLNNFKVEPFLLAVNSKAYLTTVSEKYAEELLDINNSDNTEGLSKIFNDRNYFIKGITNGIDYERYDPRETTISELPFCFDPETGDFEGKIKCREYFINEFLKNDIKDVKVFGHFEENCTANDNVYFSYHGRVTGQKGIKVLIEAIPSILNKHSSARFIIAGQGEQYLEEQLIQLTNTYSGKIIYLNGYDKTAARLTTVAGDFIILPSYFEPCGLEDFIALIYGTLPIAHKTGGLTKILDYKTGFLYDYNDSYNLSNKITEVINLFIENKALIEEMKITGAKYTHEKYLWKNVIKNEYLPFFEKILNNFKNF